MLMLVGIALTCSVVVILSESERIFSVSKEVSSEEVPTTLENLPPLTSHEEAIALADEFLKEKLGDEFFYNHFTFSKIDERPDIRSLWFVIYQYTDNGYTVDGSVAIDIGRIPEGTSRIDVDFSNIIVQPQRILISEEQAKIIAQKYGLEPPYSALFLCCKLCYHRICWRIVKEDAKIEELEGLLIDAENGTVLDSWIRTS